MFKLYWKVFLGFWFASLILGGSAVLVNLELQSIDPLEIQGLTPLKLIRQTSFVVNQLPRELEEWQVQLKEQDIDLYVRHPDRTALTQLSVPPAIDALFKELEDVQYLEKSSLTRVRVGLQEVANNGKTIKFVIDMPSTMVFRLKQLVSQLSVQFALALSLSGLLCYLLARYLTRNLKRLSVASQSLASGELSARVHLTSTNRKDELSQLAIDFNNMAEALEKSIESQRRLVRDISHELRSPLTRMQIALELARQKGPSDELDRIEREANRLNELIGQILTIPDDSGPLQDIIDTQSLLESILEDCGIEAQAKQIELRYQGRQNEALIAANADQLHSAFENIVRNAIRYSPENSCIQVSFEEQPECYQIDIRDQGPGIPEEDIEHIFKPFYRVDRARNRETGGYGIGLAIVERSILRHGGTVRAKNTDDGLIVSVQLPKLSEHNL